MRLRNVKGSREAIQESIYVVHEEETRAGSWHDIFGNNHPIHIEIGMGKGRFLMELAAKNPDINYVGIEKYWRRCRRWRHRLPISVLCEWTQKPSQRYSGQER